MITGHSGFIGSNLISALQSSKYRLIGFSTKTDANSRIMQIKKDIQQVTKTDIPKDVYCIIHLAALTDIMYCQKHPVECFKTNMIGTQSLLEMARKNDCKFIYVSTSHVYGIPKKLPVNEDHPLNPTSIYSASKIGGEICCESYSKSYGIDVSIMRLFSVYGPRSPLHLVTSKIILQLLSNKIIKVGNLYPKRDFIYITDVVRAIQIVLKKLHGFSVYNVGTGKSYSISEICDMLKKLTGLNNIPVISSKSSIRKAEIDEIVSNSSKIKKLGWKPMIPIQRGLQMTLDWYRAQSH